MDAQVKHKPPVDERHLYVFCIHHGQHMPPRSIREQRESLPTFEYREELVNALREHHVLLINSETGSGKTTQIPQYALEAMPEITRIGVTQPRRIAAITVATRVAEERGCRLGSQVGYTIRFEDATSADTRLKYMTDGVLLREATLDPQLSQYDLIVVDEAHERTIETDVLFGLLKQTRRLRPKLRILIMSATLNVEKFSDFFDRCPIFHIPGRNFPIESMFHPSAKLSALKSSYVDKAIETALHIHTTKPQGDVLVFLTGQAEIERACREIKSKERNLDYRRDVRHSDLVRTLDVYPIYASLETFEQKAVFEESRENTRKIVVATNIAQTSVTIPGIRYVIDCGFVKQKSYDPITSMDALLVEEISRAAAIQRAGRAGRTGPGSCYRLYSRDSFDAMAVETLPEIQRSSLLGTVLSLKRMGVIDVLGFEFIDPPDPELVTNALQQLYLLGALNDQGTLTSLGKTMSQFPLSPFLSRAIIAASENYSCSHDVLIIVSLISVEDIFLSPRQESRAAEAADAHRKLADPSGDHMTLLEIWRSWRDADYDRGWCKDHYLSWRNLEMARKVRDQLAEIMKRCGIELIRGPLLEGGSNKGNKRSRRRSGTDPVPILKSFLSGYYLNLAKRHPQRPLFYHYLSTTTTASTASAASSNLMALAIHPLSALTLDAGLIRFTDLEWVIYTTVIYTTKAVMKCVSKVRWEWVQESGGLERLKNLSKARLSGEKEVDVEMDDEREGARGGQSAEADTTEADATEAASRYAVEVERKRKRAEDIEAIKARALNRRKVADS